jgi:hypothetical protein
MVRFPDLARENFSQGMDKESARGPATIFNFTKINFRGVT